MTIKRRTGKRSIPTWDSIMKITGGSKGEGKTQSSIPFAKDIISNVPTLPQSNLPTIPRTTSYQHTNTGDNTGSWTAPNTNQPYTSQPYYPYVPTRTGSIPYGWEQGYGQPFTPTTTQKEKPKHDPKELAGKMVAYASVRVQGIEHTGVLFVRRCGAWKLIDCRTMNKVASGSEKEPLPDVYIHYIIYAEETDTKPKPKSRFDDIGMNTPEDGKDGTET